jgi:hypothetical protein
LKERRELLGAEFELFRHWSGNGESLNRTLRASGAYKGATARRTFTRRQGEETGGIH